MLLTLTTTRDPNTGGPATDLGFLLHKHPERVFTFSLSAGQGQVFYPEVRSARSITGPPAPPSQARSAVGDVQE